MKKDKNFSRKILFYPVLLIAAYYLCSCSLAQVKMNPLPPPPPTAKLRVHVVAVTTGTPPQGFWDMTPEKYDAWMTVNTTKMLSKLGMYDVVPAADVKKVLGESRFAGWEWKRDNWALAKDVAQAVHADYVLCLERSWKLSLQQEMTLFNMHTGMQFSTSGYLTQSRTNDERARAEIVRINYQTLFREAKGDFLRIALQKGRLLSGEKQPEATARAPKPVQEPSTVAEKPAEKVTQGEVKPKEKQLTIAEKQQAFEKELEKAISDKDKKHTGSRLVVYDFDTLEHLKVVGMILTESLREELHKLGGFVLISRENMSQFMEERKLQESGLVNEKQAIKLGEWMAANEAVTGKVAVIGSVSIVQAKRIDLTTLGTIALGSLKCKTGEEDSLLENMPELARLLTPGKNR